jgi:transcriptional regulator with XRE-family HTH domain
MPTNNASFADEVRILLARRKVKQRQLADALGLSQPAVSRRISGEREFSASEISATAEFFGVSVGELFGESTGHDHGDAA